MPFPLTSMQMSNGNNINLAILYKTFVELGFTQNVHKAWHTRRVSTIRQGVSGWVLGGLEACTHTAEMARWPGQGLLLVEAGQGVLFQVNRHMKHRRWGRPQWGLGKGHRVPVTASSPAPLTRGTLERACPDTSPHIIPEGPICPLVKT